MVAHRLEGKVAFITGAARGMGRAFAVRLAAEGADIIAIDVCSQPASTHYAGGTPEDLVETVRLVEAEGRRIVARQADVRDFASVRAAVTEGVAELGRLDVVIPNAGICSAGNSWEITEEQWAETVAVNLTGVFHTCKATIPILLEQGTGGSIVIISSLAGLRGLPFLSAYAATKHGVVGYAKSLANELAQHSIRVTTVHPGGVATGMTVDDLGPLLAAHPDLAPIFTPALPDQFSQPEDIADAVAFLASDEARHITGIQLPVDLGTVNR